MEMRLPSWLGEPSLAGADPFHTEEGTEPRKNTLEGKWEERNSRTERKGAEVTHCETLQLCRSWELRVVGVGMGVSICQALLPHMRMKPPVRHIHSASHVTSLQCYFLTRKTGKMTSAQPSSKGSFEIQAFTIRAPGQRLRPRAGTATAWFPAILLRAQPQSKRSINIWWVNK